MNHQTTKLMDLDDDWEYLPDSFLLLRPDSPPLNDAVSLRSTPSSLINMDYFSHHSRPPPSPTHRAKHVVQRLLLQQQEEEEALMMHHQELNLNNNNTDAVSAAASTVSFNKESTESVDMNNFLDSTASHMATSPRTVMMQKINVLDDLFNQDEMIIKSKSSEDKQVVVKGEVNWIGEGIIGDDHEDDDDAGFNIWKLGFGGIGAICSFGFAAATVCLILFGGGANQKAKQSHKLRFQIYGADDQRMKQVVEQASKINEAMSAAVRGVPLNRAHITYGGYYENSL